MSNQPRLSVSTLGKSFVLHTQGGATIAAFSDVCFEVNPGECVALDGPSGSGKSSILRSVYGNYLIERGQIRIDTGSSIIDIGSASPRELLTLRKHVVGYVSQFLRAIPRTSCVDVVCAPLMARGMQRSCAQRRAKTLLQRLNIDKRLWSLAPATFSGGEQQRVNVARALVGEYPLLLLDEPTASLDSVNAEAVTVLIEEACAQGCAVLGIFHDPILRARLAGRMVHLQPMLEQG